MAMKEQRVSLLIVGVFFLLGGVLMSARYQWRKQTRVAPGEGVWKLTYAVELETRAKGGRVRLALPSDSASNRVIGQELSHPLLRPLLPRGTRAENRILVATAAKPGRYTLGGEFIIHVRPKARWKVPAVLAGIKPEKRGRWLGAEPGVRPNNELVRGTLARLRGPGGSTRALVGRIQDHCRQAIAPGPAMDDVTALKRKAAAPLGRARAMVALCRAAEVPARLVTGFTFAVSRDAKPQVWVEVRLEKAWVPFDPVSGYTETLPPSRIVVRRGGWRVLQVGEKDVARVTYAIARTNPPEQLATRAGEHWTEILDFTRLPLSMHEVLATLLLLPFGAIITGLFRNIIGLRTFGTFAPVLLALAFVFTDARSGLLVLLVVLVGGLAIRHLLNYLKLLMVARLGVVLTMVVSCLVLGISAVEYVSRSPNPQLVILPMVILTGLVEQIYITSEEDTWGYTAKLILGTALVGSCCYAVLVWKGLGRFVIRYPEIHLFTMGVLILIGRYAGYRLTELWRFHDLVRGGAATPAVVGADPAETRSAGEPDGGAATAESPGSNDAPDGSDPAGGEVQ